MGLGIKLVVELLGQMVVQFNFFSGAGDRAPGLTQARKVLFQ